MDEALKVFNALVAADPTDPQYGQSEIQISEIQRRQGHYERRWRRWRRRSRRSRIQLELSYNEALIYDALGKYDQATDLNGILDSTAHPDGKYSDQEKRNRAYFLNRLGIIYREQNKTTEAVAATSRWRVGGDYTRDGYQGQGGCLPRCAPVEGSGRSRSRRPRRLMPKDHAIQLMYAQQLADMGKVEEGIALAKAQLTRCSRMISSRTRRWPRSISG